MNDVVKPRLLVVEDERIVALDLKFNLEALGFDVVGMVANQGEVVRMVLKHRPDLVLMDINLGAGGDGINAAIEMLAYVHVPVVFLTAYADSDVLQRAAKVAPYGYLVKPIEIRELNATVRMALARHGSQMRQLQTEARLRMALDTARMGVVTMRTNADVVEIDGHFPLLSADSLHGLRMDRKEFLAGLTHDSRAQVNRLLEEGGDLHILTKWQGDPDQDALRWLEVHGAYFEVEDAVVGVFRDVTDRVLDEQRLRQAAVVFDSAADGILILDKHDRLITANQAFLSLTGWTMDAIRGRHPDDFLHARRAADRELLSASAQDGTLHAEVQCMRADGSSFPAWEHVAAVRNDAGEITQRVLTFSDITALRQAESRLRHLAYHDPLTGLGNRNQLMQSLSNLEREQTPFALLFLDLDGFKTINDTLGHQSGDRLLVTVADRFRQVLRHGDEAVRVGGDEFVFVLRMTASDHIDAMAHRVLEAIRVPILMEENNPIQISGSLGVATYPHDARSAADLMRAADVAMYAAKSRGRNRIARFSAGMLHEVNTRLQLEQGLHGALECAELALHWQPQVAMETGAILGAEVLLRWTSPTLGVVTPDRFIPLAEESGLIVPLGRWVAQEAIRQWTQWHRAGLRPGRVALNCSAVQLQDDQFAQMLAVLIEESGIPPTAVEVELTETALQRVPDIRARLDSLTRIGVRIALDDFGTGYSSLSMLKLLPLHRLKIDRGFVRDLVHCDSDRAIVAAIVAMAEALDFEVIAEGVETEDQRSVLATMRVPEGQGWLFARAAPAHEMQRLLSAAIAS